MVCYHQGRYGVEIMIESILGDKTCSWVRIVNGIKKYVMRLTFKVLERRVQGNTPRKQDHDRHQIQRCLLYLFRIVNESG